MSRVLFVEAPDYYAQLEALRRIAPDDRPLLVGGDPRKRGRVQSASAAARTAGVRDGMSVQDALRLCPRARALRTDMPHYREQSRRFFALLRRIATRCEPLGLSAAWIDPAGAAQPPQALAEALREAAARELGLSLRVGVAANKFVARLAAEEAGAAGVRAIAAGAESEFLDGLALTRIEGVGEKTAAVLERLGARTIGGVARLGRTLLHEQLGAHGLRIHALACAEDASGIRAQPHARSLSRERRFAIPTQDRVEIAEQLEELVRQLARELELQALFAGRIALKLRFEAGAQQSRSCLLEPPGRSVSSLGQAAARLLERSPTAGRSLRGAALLLDRLTTESASDGQLDLFGRR